MDPKKLLSDIAARSRQHQQEQFVRWLEIGGRPEPKTDTMAGFTAWQQLHDLYEFCAWIESRNAWIAEITTFGLIAADGPDERRWEPQDGLSTEGWPYLKACSALAEDDEVGQINRNEIVAAILENQLRRSGYAFAGAAVASYQRQFDESGVGPFWAAVEDLGFEAVLASLEEQARTIANEFKDARPRRQGHADGPDERFQVFWWHGEHYPLPPKEFHLVSLLWSAPGRSLPLSDVLHDLYGLRRAASQKSYIHPLRQRATEAGKALMNTGIRVSVRKKRVSLELS